MNMLSLEPELMVEDVLKTIEFYSTVMGFKVGTKFPEDTPTFARLIKNDFAISFYERTNFELEVPDFKSKEMGGTFEILIKAVGVEDFYNEIKDKVVVVQDIHKTDYSTLEFTIKDCNGYILGFSEETSS